MVRLFWCVAGLAVGVAAGSGVAQEAKPKEAAAKASPQTAVAAPRAQQPVDLSKPTLYVVGYAHLDTQWRWCYPQVIREFIPETLHGNFALFEKYPDYVFNFSGSRRYKMIEEYYPQDFVRLKQEVAAGKWFTCGSSVDENDANVPSGESQLRHVLYGNAYFKDRFGTQSDEFMLPDCFGFPASLPSVLAHCGLKGFSTQKLTWNAVTPIPFKVGVWNGPDGKGVVAALDPGAYVGEVLEDLSKSNGWLNRINANGKVSGTYVDYHYYGTGDKGGAPTERSVKMVQQSVSGGVGDDSERKVRVVSARADAMFNAIDADRRAKLPSYQGELELIEHSAGSLTSAAIMKRWNRKNELLADAAERVATAAWMMGKAEYPAQTIEDAWYLILGSQMHDILPGTSHPTAYDYSQNDEVIAGNLLSGVLTDSVSALAKGLDTRGGEGGGTPIIVYNPLSFGREDVVECDVPGEAGAGVTVTDASGRAVAAQVVAGAPKGFTRIAFAAVAPSVGLEVYHVRLGDVDTADAPASSGGNWIENSRYKVTFNVTGDVASIFDKGAQREVLSGPITLNQCFEKPANWPAWNQDWADRVKPVKEVVSALVQMRVVEDGPARVVMQVMRREGPSMFTQLVRLNHGAGEDRVEFVNTIDWNARERSLRVAFPLAVSNKTATWDGQVGVVTRGNASKQQYEYAGQQWMDLTDAKGDYGVTIINDCKYASDKLTDNMLRLTLLHTPGVHNEYQDQGTQDIGRHEVTFAVQAHDGDWRDGGAARQAMRVNQPLLAFRTTAHAAEGVKDGVRGPVSMSLVRVSGDSTYNVVAVKRAENGEGVIVRLRETSGQGVKGGRVWMKGVASAIAVDGQERPIEGGAVEADGDGFAADIDGFGLRTVLVRMTRSDAAAAAGGRAVGLKFDTDVISTNAKRGDGAMVEGLAYPAEQVPARVTVEGVVFAMGKTGDGEKNAVACRGQEVKVDAKAGEDMLYVLAAADGDVEADVMVDGAATRVKFQDWKGYVGLWDRRVWGGTVEEMAFNWKNPLTGLEPGFVKPGRIGWHASHHHTAKGDAYYQYCYMFVHAVPLKDGVGTITLPDDPRIKVFAMTVGKRGAFVEPAAPLFDTLAGRPRMSPLGIRADTPTGDYQTVRIEPGLFFREGAIRYTVDGTTPTAQSAVWTGEPILIYEDSMVRAGTLDESGKLGVILGANVQAHDTTPPRVLGASTAYMSREVRLEFSEPVGGGLSFRVNPANGAAVAVKSSKVAADGRSATVVLEQPLEVDQTYKLSIKGLKDRAPKANEAGEMTVDVMAAGPVFTIDVVSPQQRGKAIAAPGLPVKAGDAWTMNMFVKMDVLPRPRTLIAGFGSAKTPTSGTGRYMARMQGGMHFWSHHSDVTTKTPLEVGAWQMLTATYDGRVLRLYKNAAKTGELEVALAEDESVVNIAPIDPWEKQRKFEGEVRRLMIWPGALDEAALRSLWVTMRPE